MATYSGSSIKVQGNVNLSTATHNATIYTCAADSYAILNIHVMFLVTTGVRYEVLNTGQVCLSGASVGPAGKEENKATIYVGPGGTINLQYPVLLATGNGSVRLSATGVEFKNSP